MQPPATIEDVFNRAMDRRPKEVENLLLEMPETDRRRMGIDPQQWFALCARVGRLRNIPRLAACQQMADHLEHLAAQMRLICLERQRQALISRLHRNPKDPALAAEMIKVAAAMTHLNRRHSR